MAVKRLLDTKELNIQYIDDKKIMVWDYDENTDILMILYVALETPTIVHYLGDGVGLLYDPESKNVVGIQVEDFKSQFLPMHPDLDRLWTTVNGCQDLGKATQYVHSQQPKVAEGVAEVAEEMYGKSV